MNSLALYQYEEIKTAVIATTATGNFSLIWPETIINEVARELDNHDGFLVDENSTRVSWRNPSYPTREIPSLHSNDRAFVSSLMAILVKIQTNRRERYSSDSYYAYISASPDLPSAALKFLNTYYVDRIGIYQTNPSKEKSTYFVKWTYDFYIEDKYQLYLKVASQYRQLFIHFS
ncbi:MAG: hypothetical protein IKG14_00220 [Clostridia bacterium]|nr:hypothetical protein [Clostridia bacterium]